MTTEVEVFYENNVVEVLPVTEVDVIEIVSSGPQGPGGAAGTGATEFVLAEVPSGAVNDVNQDYTTAATFTELWVWLNGLRMQPGSDYNVTSSNSFHFLYPPFTGATLIVDYTT